MLYENYQKRIDKIACVLAKVVRMLPIIIISLILILGAVAALMIAKGSISSFECPVEMVYGDDIQLNASAFLSDVWYEYREENGEWSENMPRVPGTYEVRAVSAASFGGKKYSDVKTITLLAKSITVKAIDELITYGEHPTFSAELVYDDSLVCEDYDRTVGEATLILPTLTSSSHVTAYKYKVKPYADSIRIFDKDGNDVTSAYIIEVEESEHYLTQRNITVSTENVTKIYDGKPLTDVNFEHQGTLKTGDSINAVFNAYIEDCGAILNAPQITILNESEEDVTKFYNILTDFGYLRVEKRTVIISTPSVEYEYDGEEKICNEFYCSEENGPAEGHKVVITNGVTYTDAGTYENTPKFIILNEEGKDRSANYDILLTPGKITIHKRPITVASKDQRIVYDGEKHPVEVYLESGELVEGHVFSTDDTSPFINAGTYESEFSLSIVDENGKSMLNNYEVTRIFGEMIIEKRLIEVITPDGQWIYDGYEHSYEDCGEGLIVNKIVSSHSFVVDPKSETIVRNAGTVENYLLINVYDSNWNDVTSNYNIEYTYGELKIDKRPITIQTGSYHGIYDGEYHSSEIFEIISSLGLGYGDEIQLNRFTHINNIVVNGSTWPSIKNVGQIDNIVDLKIYYPTYDYDISIPDIDFTEEETTTEDWIETETEIEEWIEEETFGSVYPEEEIIETEECIEEYFETVEYSEDYTEDYEETSDFLIEIDPVPPDGRVYVDVTDNYDITWVFGTLTVDKCEITIETGSASWIYDGQSHSHEQYQVIPKVHGYGIAANEELSLEDWPSVINVGPTVDNICQQYAIIENGQTVELDKNYEVEWVYGTLEILQRPLRIKPVDREKVYDGEPLIPEGTEYSEGSDEGLVQGHTLSVSISGSQTDAGFSNSEITSIQIFNGSDIVTPNYNVILEKGTLTVYQRPITVCTKSAEKVYDRTPLMAKGYVYAEDTEYRLVGNHKLSLYVWGSQTEIGESLNGYDLEKSVITDIDGRNVTPNYIIFVNEGTLKVNPVAVLYVLSASDSKDYDGTPLENHNYTLKETQGSIAEHLGHRLEVEIYGTQTMPGVSPNIIEVDILDENGQDVSDYYILNVTEGKLEVFSNEDEGDDYTGPIGSIYTNKSGLVYLRGQSYGNYTGQIWSDGPEYWKTLPGDINYNYLASYALMNKGIKPGMATLSQMMYYLLPYYQGFNGSYIPSPSDVHNNVYMSFYTIEYYSADLLDMIGELKGMLGEYSAYEEEYREFVYELYLDIDDESRDYMNSIISAEGFDANDPEIIKKVATYIQNAATYNKEFDKNLEREENVAIAFLDEYKEGVCRHYAAAATLLYRSLGIPARYVTGYMIDVKANALTEISGERAHAWVEVYIDGLGWVMVEVTGGEGASGGGSGSGSGSGGSSGDSECDGSCGGTCDECESKKKVIKLFLYQLQKYYDGTPIYFENEDYEIIEIEDGLDLEVSLTISMTNVGWLTLEDLNQNISEYISYRVLKDGEDVTSGYRIEFDCFEGMNIPNYLPLKVDKRVITLKADSATKVYDGIPLEGIGAHISMGSLVSGHTIEVITDGYIDVVGETENHIIDYRIFDADGSDVTYNYEVKTETGLLKILPQED